MRPSQGDIWWVESTDQKGRPYLVLTRNSAIDVLNSLTAAPLTSRIRHIPTEVELGVDDGLRRSCVATLDNTSLVAKRHMIRRVGQLADGRWHEVCAALGATIDC